MCWPGPSIVGNAEGPRHPAQAVVARPFCVRFRQLPSAFALHQGERYVIQRVLLLPVVAMAASELFRASPRVTTPVYKGATLDARGRAPLQHRLVVHLQVRRSARCSGVLLRKRQRPEPQKNRDEDEVTDVHRFWTRRPLQWFRCSRVPGRQRRAHESSLHRRSRAHEPSIGRAEDKCRRLDDRPLIGSSGRLPHSRHRRCSRPQSDPEHA